MAGKKKKPITNRELRSLRTRQMVFIAIGLIVILSMVISLVAK